MIRITAGTVTGRASNTERPGVTFLFVYIDEGVAAPDGSEYTVEAFRATAPGPGRSGSALSMMVVALKGDWRSWKVRVRPWPHKVLEDQGWTTLVGSEDEAAALADHVRDLVETGTWRPEDGEPPGRHSAPE